MPLPMLKRGAGSAHTHLVQGVHSGTELHLRTNTLATLQAANTPIHAGQSHM